MNSIKFSKNMCLTCHQCEMACAVYHSNTKNLFSALSEPVKPKARLVITVDKKTIQIKVQKCKHCNSAPCIKSCQYGAISKDPLTGLVIVDEYKCKNCQNCKNACPFDAIRFEISNKPDNKRVVALKCDGCYDRTQNNGIPACVEACKSGALSWAC